MVGKKLAGIGIVLLGIFTALPWACSSNNNPSSPYSSNPTNTPTITSTPTPTPLIYWYQAYATSGFSVVDLQVSSAAVSNAQVTLFGPSLSSPLTYSGPATEGPGVFARYQNSGIASYQGGATYSLVSATSAGTASVTLIAPGGGPYSISPNSVTVTWARPGNWDSIYYYLNGSLFNQSGHGISDPYSIPASIYSAPGTYLIRTLPANNALPVNAGVSPGGTAPYLYDRYDFSVTLIFTPTNTPTFTATPTVTSTPTITNTPTDSFTPVPTNTFTFTFTATNSPTVTPTYTPVGTITPGVPIAQWGGTGTGNGKFNGPQGIAVDTSGNVYVADYTNSRIEKFDSTGNYLTQWSGPGYPYGVAADPAGNVYVADYANARVEKYTSSGAPLTQWGTVGTGNGQFKYPVGVAADAATNIYVTDTFYNSRVEKFDSIGNYLTQWGTYGTADGQFEYPQLMAVDSSGNVYVTDRARNDVQKFDSSGNFLTKWGSYGTGNGSFNIPIGIAVDASGNVYVADNGNNLIQKFDTSGNFQSQWGGAGSGNGKFNGPYGVAVDSSGNVYVSDYGNNLIQKFGP